MEEEREGTLLPDDVVREILLQVPTDDIAALFRCAVTCKQWRAVVADLSFLRHHWPENACHPSSLLGFFDKRYDKKEPDPPFFCPVSPGSVLGGRRRFLISFAPGAPGDILNDAVPLAARGGLLLLRLAGDSLHLAVCDVLTGACNMLPPLECKVSRCGCAILPREDCSSLHGQQGRTPMAGYSTFFKLLAIVISDNDRDSNLYTFLSSEPKWSQPTKCFDEVSQHDIFRLQMRLGSSRVVVCSGVAYWFGSYYTDQWNLRRYFTLGVNVETDQISFNKLSIPANKLDTRNDYFALMLSAAVDARLSLFHLQKEGLRLNTWTRGNDETWLHTRVIELKPPRQGWNPGYVAMLSGEKSGALFMTDLYKHVYKTDPETGVMEDVTMEMFQDSLGIMTVPMEIDWPALFTSRLAV